MLQAYDEIVTIRQTFSQSPIILSQAHFFCHPEWSEAKSKDPAELA
jgi:hypothetical protein